MDTLAEITDRIARGYKGELIYNYGTSTYVITTWLEGAENIDQKIYKFPVGKVDPNALKTAVYGPGFKK